MSADDLLDSDAARVLAETAPFGVLAVVTVVVALRGAFDLARRALRLTDRYLNEPAAQMRDGLDQDEDGYA